MRRNMFLKGKFTAIEAQLKLKVKQAEKEFVENYGAITRAQAANGMLGSGNTLIMVKDAAINCYEKYSNESTSLILQIFNGEDNKVYTCFGVNKLKNLFEECKTILRQYLETELSNKLHSPALGGNDFQKAKIQIQEEIKPRLMYIDGETNLTFGSQLSKIKRISWYSSWLFKQATTIVVSAITAIIISLITKRFL